MRSAWSADELDVLDRNPELEITTRRADLTLRPWRPIWVVRVGGHVYVRTWYRRTTGWFGHAVRTSSALIRAGGIECDVDVEDLGDAESPDIEAVSRAYTEKYGEPGGGSVGGMVSAAAAATTLRLRPRSDGATES